MKEYSGAEKELMEQLDSICDNSNKSKYCIKYQTDPNTERLFTVKCFL